MGERKRRGSVPPLAKDCELLPGEYSNRWFQAQGEPIWRKHLLPIREEIKRYIEIGVNEGQSMLFALTHFPVEQALGVDGYKPDKPRHKEEYAAFRRRMQANLADHLASGRLKMLYESSEALYRSGSWDDVVQDQWADLIYVDGAHESWAVLEDALNCWRKLRVGGIMVFDDMQRRYVLRPLCRYGVQAFLDAWDTRYEHFYMEPRQWAVRKVK